MSQSHIYRVEFQSTNPYESIYPNRRVVSRETLHLIKNLRSKGYSVIVTPDDGSEINYIAEKGVKEFLSTPIIATLVGIPLGVLTSLIASYTFDSLKELPKPETTNIVIKVDQEGKELHYNHIGAPISDSKFKELVSLLKERSKIHQAIRTIPPPNPIRPVPIFLEHSPKLVGWGNIKTEDKGLFVEEAIITDDNTYSLLKSGTLKGFSIGGLVRKPICGICNKNYIYCNHIAGELYDEKECINKITKMDLVEISIVREPINENCKIYTK